MSTRRRWGHSGRVAATMVAVVALLTACSSGGSAASPSTAAQASAAAAGAASPASAANAVVVNYWYWLDTPTVPTFQTLISEFNASHPNIRVVGQLVPLSDYENKLITAVSSGSAPDAARFKDWWVGQFATQGVLASLTPDIQKWSGQSDVISSLWKTGELTPSGPVYMLPHQYITFYLYYRKDLFAAAGLQPPTTQAEFVADAQKLTNASKNQYGFDVRGGSGGQDQWAAWMLASGARFVDAQNNVTINTPAAVQANQQYIDLLKDSPPGAVNDAYAQVLQNFENGTIAMMAHHIGSYQILQQKLGSNLGVVPYPPADPSNPATLGSMSGNVIFSQSKVQQAAWTWISWLDSQQAMTELSESPNGQLPVLTSVGKLPFFSNPFYQVALKEEQYAITYPPLPGVGQYANTTWQKSFQQALLGQISSQQMLTQIAAALSAKAP